MFIENSCAVKNRKRLFRCGLLEGRNVSLIHSRFGLFESFHFVGNGREVMNEHVNLEAKPSPEAQPTSIVLPFLAAVGRV